ncbi:MAG: adenylate/guanylate cyclase domain-containing protein [Gammaproteobacteria bacterium]|nr:adenylate/guanylate cyclase domain-containing protein [Gammaproteobacteria bacterium]
MEPKNQPRKLAAILYADVVGYSRMMGADESGTLARLKAHRKELIDPTVASHHGRMVKLMGDGALIEFASVVDALACAVEIQRGMAERNQNESAEQCIEFRMGINLGDVIIEGDDIYGDGVNVAARLEGLAQPGGVCISESVRTAVGNKLSFGYESMGEQQVKNIAESVKAYRVVVDAGEEQKVMSSEKPTLELPDKPSIAVLPFTNMSGDPEQEYFSDGITEDIITSLSRISGLLVVARNSTMVYKGTAVDIKQVGREQGVRYVLEGSVRKGGNRVRVTGQLIDTTTGHHLWAEHYDRELDDIFAVQDEITQKVTLEMQVQLTYGEQARLRVRGTNSIEARERVLRAMELIDRHIREDNLEGRRLAEEALQIDPHYALAWVALGWTHWIDAYWGWGESSEISLEPAMEAGQKALDIDETDPDALSLLSVVYMFCAEHNKAVQMAEKGASLAPSHADAQALWAYTLNGLNKPKEAIQPIKRAMRLCPIYHAWYLMVLADSYRLMGKRDLVVSTLNEAIKHEPDSALAAVWLANVLADAELLDEAKAAAEKVLSIDPTFTLTRGRAGICFYKDPALNERALENLRKAGLPE